MINKIKGFQNLLLLLNVNCLVYVVSQIYNNGLYIFSVIPINMSNYKYLEPEKCNEYSQIFNINSSLLTGFSLLYFIYKCHFLRLNFVSIHHYILTLLINIVSNIFNIVYYYIFFPIEEVKRECDNFYNLQIYIYFNIINLSFLGYNMLIYVYNRGLNNNIDN